jgi:hypothetical protein
MKTNPYFKFLSKEDHLQIQVCNYLRLQYHGIAIHHSPNAGKRSRFEQYKMKVLGCSAGYPDLTLCYGGLTITIELKVEKNKATTFQKGWIETLNDNNVPSSVCTGFDQAKEFADKYFMPLKLKAA